MCLTRNSEEVSRIMAGTNYDVIVIGGGAAGLAGATALLRSRRSVLVVDGGRTM